MAKSAKHSTANDPDYGRRLSLDAWLARLEDPAVDRQKIITYQFPTDAHRDGYLQSIEGRSDKEVRTLLRAFLIESGSLGTDKLTLHYTIHRIKQGEKVQISEFGRRLLRFAARNGRGVAPPWEGVSWVLDLLPWSPRKALDVLDAYFEAHCGVMPDGRLEGMGDARAVIRAKYILVGDREGSGKALDKLSSRELEVLVAALYRAKGYRVVLTRASRDGGKDVVATRLRAGERERCLVECKHHRSPIGVKDVRALLGVVSDGRCTKGTLVTTAHFTAGSKRLSERNKRIELIPRDELVQLLNQFLGTNWPLRVDRLLLDEAREHTRPSPSDAAGQKRSASHGRTTKRERPTPRSAR
jgi:restriction system protein